ncbi:nitroreductase family protein [Marinifilum caeruleilacunae]|uniref:NAD(P)H-dependent dehydrogenase/reductase n=1 Tax=Marinifilum caeruleilacunae TaxID=2499076 RepID=A0ABX1WX16_9BACT|nr:nitroreductase family protein [Marinifilum caeruleilacunae]NOU60657.1 NAD(P)H-dependent dehydrogenase/reductase [Marinifilum caeruleilacunae]
MLDILYKRRSVRRFTSEEVEKEKIERILHAGLLAPSSKSKYPCEFIVCDQAELNQNLAASKPGGANFLKYAPVSIVITGDEEKSDVWIEDCSIAAAYMLLQAEKENLGACWVQIRERKYDEDQLAEAYIREVLQIPENQKVLAIIGLGKKDGEKEGRDESFLMKEKIHWNKF